MILNTTDQDGNPSGLKTRVFTSMKKLLPSKDKDMVRNIMGTDLSPIDLLYKIASRKKDFYIKLENKFANSLNKVNPNTNFYNLTS